MGLLSLIIDRLERLRGNWHGGHEVLRAGWESVLGHRRKLATLGLAGLVLLFTWHVIFGANGMVVYGQKRSQYRELQLEIEKLENDNRDLADRNKALQSDPEAIEREAREQLRYAKPGEVVVVMPGAEPEAPPSDASAQQR